MKRIKILNNETEHLELITKWCHSVENATRVALHDILDWCLPVTLRVIVEERQDTVEFTDCPHCNGGKLRKLKTPRLDGYDYSCYQCARGWIVKDNGDWDSMFSSVPTNYTKEEVFDCQPHKFLSQYILKLNRMAR